MATYILWRPVNGDQPEFRNCIGSSNYPGWCVRSSYIVHFHILSCHQGNALLLRSESCNPMRAPKGSLCNEYLSALDFSQEIAMASTCIWIEGK